MGASDDWATRDVRALARELGTSLENGIAVDTFRERQAAWGANVVRPRSWCPKALCCLLPCLRLDATRRRVQREGPDFAMCVRSGRRFDVAAAELVPGDVVELDPSYRVPADCRSVATAAAARAACRTPRRCHSPARFPARRILSATDDFQVGRRPRRAARAL